MSLSTNNACLWWWRQYLIHATGRNRRDEFEFRLVCKSISTFVADIGRRKSRGGKLWVGKGNFFFQINYEKPYWERNITKMSEFLMCRVSTSHCVKETVRPRNFKNQPLNAKSFPGRERKFSLRVGGKQINGRTTNELWRGRSLA
jgi:hypothetical protein